MIMPLANFFDKTALSLAQLLHGDADSFSPQLHAQYIRIQFTSETAAKKDGAIMLDLLTRLLARLYPNLNFFCSDKENHLKSIELGELALDINPNIDCNYKEEDTIVVNIGLVESYSGLAKQFFIGSDQWLGFFSQATPQNCIESNNPFGAGFAACLAAANVFRFVFSSHLPYYGLDNDLIFSVFDYSVNESAIQGPVIKRVEFVDTILVGLGAIGNGVAWTLEHLDIGGELTLVDPETIALSNLQRYVLATQKDIAQPKSEHISKILQKEGLQIHAFSGSWQSYMQHRKDWNMPFVVTALDSAEDRIAVQSALPHKIINGWTQREQLGVSRHFDFIHQACLACLYLPTSQRLSLSQEIAKSLNIPNLEQNFIRRYLAENIKIDEPLIQIIASANHISVGELKPFLGKSMEAFYSEVVCGGVFLRLTGNLSGGNGIHVPAAFESALAGILLAADLYKVESRLGQPQLPNTTKINLIRPLTEFTVESSPKDISGRCICNDPVYLKAFNKKWEMIE
jgi:molybdopterin/thiamine biosynthesis adenylyltransferase